MVEELDVFACPLDGIALIEASAGTGKTWNICGLYLRQLLEKDLPVSNLLVVTFTRAATAELSARILGRIRAALRVLEGGSAEIDPFTQSLLASARGKGIDEKEITRRLRDALISFDEAAVFTIHGFCQRALADASFSAGLSSAFEVSEDDAEQRLDVARDFWRREVSGIEPMLADYLLEKRDSPENWAKWLGQAHSHPLAETRWDEGTVGEESESDALLRQSLSEEEKLERSRRKLLRRFIEGSGAKLRGRKQSERRISYDDLLWNAFDAVSSRPWLASALQARYPVALIDEFQDTDPLQLAIFQGIYASGNRHGNLFLVGDPKQAIYSFRGADLQTYLGARALAGAHYTLGINHRSTPALVAACNRLFSENPSVFMEKGLDFRPVKAAAPAQILEDKTHASSGNETALRLWRIPGLLRADAKNRAAAASATEIARLLAASRRGEIKIGERPLAPADFAVLVRSHREGRMMRSALSARGVGSVELSQESVFESFEAEELAQVLAAIAEPGRERLCRRALATVLMGWDAVALAKLIEDDGESVRQSERFRDWNEDWQRHGFAFMLWRWMNDTQAASKLLAQEDGERRLTNLLHLAELLQRESGNDSPAELLRTLAARRAESGKGEEALLRLESDRNLVQIVTVHSSKGLQYGIVFCPFLFDAHPPKGQTGPARIWHEKEGGQVMDWRDALDKKTAAAIKERLTFERNTEALRLIYVALTRAIYRCVLVVGCYEKPSKESVSTTESTRSLLNWMAAGGGMDAAQWKKSKMSPADIDARWRALADQSEGTISLEDLPSGEGEPLPFGEGQITFSAPQSPAVPEGWRMGSYSALVSGASHEGAAQDHDARVELTAGPETAVSMPEDDILRFPRGAAAGDCVHALFEGIDFTRPETFPAGIGGALAAHPLRTAAEPALLARMLSGLIANVLATPLLGDGDVSLRLETVPLSKRLSEFGFCLPSPRLETEKLGEWLARHGYGMPRLSARSLNGYLKGYIDLVFEHGGRYWVLDWKTNTLGNTPSAYAPAALEGAMRQHGYHLQHLLYTVALHRHLRQSLPDYGYTRHVGGTFYLFVRGVRPHWRADGVAAGVFRHHAPQAAIESLDALLAGHGMEACR
ncbi:MAG: UvrD-helicase domain-containing protein [Azoarcus sp.]|jgi:exodeoxyribonuclease V beta subunit|nr:UvrD-helicase domain-containing protein [Azoarcus sp.]